MESGRTPSPRMFRLWIATYSGWRPRRWNDSPPRATAVELVEDALYSADEAALFLQGFNGSMLECDRPVWAVALPVTLRYEGDAEPGAIVRGYVFADDQAARDVPCTDGGTSCEGSSAGNIDSLVSMAGDAPSVTSALAADHLQGFDQSPQRSR